MWGYLCASRMSRLVSGERSYRALLICFRCSRRITTEHAPHVEVGIEVSPQRRFAQTACIICRQQSTPTSPLYKSGQCIAERFLANFTCVSTLQRTWPRKHSYSSAAVLISRSSTLGLSLEEITRPWSVFMASSSITVRFASNIPIASLNIRFP